MDSLCLTKLQIKFRSDEACSCTARQPLATSMLRPHTFETFLLRICETPHGSVRRSVLLSVGSCSSCRARFRLLTYLLLFRIYYKGGLITLLIFFETFTMAEEGGDPQIPVQPQDPEFELEQHVKFRRKQQISSAVLSRLITENLSDFKPIMNGKAHAFTTLKIRNSGIKQLSDVIKEYQHLRQIDLSFNLLQEIPNLLHLKFVIKIQLARNLLAHANFLSRESVFPYLKQINLQGNKITSLPAVALKSLRRLNLNQNLINTLQDFDGHPVLQILELRANKLKTLKGLKNVPSLLELYVAENELTDLKQISKANCLIKLNARKNRIANLSEFPDLPSLRYLNLRQNQIAKVNDLTGVGESIKTINLLANPIEAELADNTKKEVWMRFRNFLKINKVDVTAEEREEFDKEYRDRLAEQEKERLEKEAAERQARQQQEKQAA